MAVRSRDLQNTHPRLPARIPNVPGILHGNLTTLLSLVTVVLALIAVSLVVNAALTWGRVALDDLRYGRPRTFQIEAFVGHHEEQGKPTRMIAMNMNRQIVVMVIPGGDATNVHTLKGPYLFGDGEDLTPATLRLEDVNRDQNVDLILQVKNEEIIYMNRDAQFNLISPEERQQLLQQGAAQ
jgi:hypothetical protein